MKHLSAAELRHTWINFFQKNNHLYVESKSLIPNDDPSLLWINSGVATLKKYFSGLENPPANRLVNLQKAVRTNDIENVGKTARHHTFFEMMGNFSIGDYFKKEAIQFAYDFLIHELEMDPNLLYITVYEKDDVAYRYWLELGISSDHLFKENKERNFWDVGNGPCGPCTEIYFDRGIKYDPQKIGIKLLADDLENDRYVEIWNIVFSEFNNDGHNNYKELKRKNIDTGAGYERFLSVLQETPTNYDTDLFLPLIRTIQEFSAYKYDVNAFFGNNEKQKEVNRWFKVIADHIKSAVFMIADGALPSNKDRGYILRRLIRRALSFAERLQLREGWLKALILKIIEQMSSFYPYLNNLKSKLLFVIQKEADSFNKALKEGLKQFNFAVQNHELDAQHVFDLVQTYGFPKVLVDEMCAEQNLKYDQTAYEELFKQHQQISKENGVNNIKAWAQQNKNLLELKVESEFDYNALSFDDVQIVALFNDHFEPISQLSGSGWVVLNKTCLYATGGGQVHDDGTINDFAVDDVIKGPNFQNLHHVNAAYLRLNEHVSVKTNQDTRMRLRCNHTGVHIIEALLKKHIDPAIKQAGAFKNKHKFTFDFTYDKKIDNCQIQNIEDEANKIIQQQIEISVLHTTLAEARSLHATMDFEANYQKQKQLRLIQIPNVSLELCGGTHAFNTSNLEILKITNYSSLGSGVFRIEGFTRYVNYYEHLQTQCDEQYQINSNVFNNIYKNTKNKEINAEQWKQTTLFAKVQYFIDAMLNANNNDLRLQFQLQTQTIIKQIQEVNNKHEHLIVVNNLDHKLLSETLRSQLNEIHDVIVLINKLPHGFAYLIGANKQYLNDNKIDLNALVKAFNLQIQGHGGGKNTYFQGGSDLMFTPALLETFFNQLK